MSESLALPSKPYAMFSSMEQLKRTGSWLTMLIYRLYRYRTLVCLTYLKQFMFAEIDHIKFISACNMNKRMVVGVDNLFVYFWGLVAR